jgi:hypothetical protein
MRLQTDVLFYPNKAFIYLSHAARRLGFHSDPRTGPTKIAVVSVVIVFAARRDVTGPTKIAVAVMPTAGRDVRNVTRETVTRMTFSVMIKTEMTFHIFIA